MGPVPLTATRHMCSPLRGDTVDDTVLFGTTCLLLATSVADKEPKLWRNKHFPLGRDFRGLIHFPRSPWGKCLPMWIYLLSTSTGPLPKVVLPLMWAPTFGLVLCWVLKRRPANPALS